MQYKDDAVLSNPISDSGLTTNLAEAGISRLYSTAMLGCLMHHDTINLYPHVAPFS